MKASTRDRLQARSPGGDLVAIGGTSVFPVRDQRVRLLSVCFSCTLTLAPVQALLTVSMGGTDGARVFSSALPEMPLGTDSFGTFAVGLDPQTQVTAGGQPQLFAPIPGVIIEPGDTVGLFISPTNAGEVLSSVSWCYELVPLEA